MRNEREPRERVAVKIPKPIWFALAEMAVKESRTGANLVEKILADYLEKAGRLTRGLKK